MMNAFSATVQSGDQHELILFLDGFMRSGDVSENELLAMLEALDMIVERFPQVSVIEHRRQSITWYAYEHLIWTVGESFRQVLKKQKRLRASQPLFQAIENVASRTKFGKGRQSFVMLMGHYGGKGRVPILLSLLQDREVAGHAVYALRLLGAEEAREAMRPFLESDKAWVRREARRYFDKVNRHLEGANSG